jgi:ribonuclease M5
MEDKLKLKYPVVVEGKYDKIRLSNLLDSPVVVLGGFSVFHDTEKKLLLKRLCKEKGLILLTDSDRAGAFLRSKLKGILTDGKVYQVYAPQLIGKEKRKTRASADGLLGVEGIDCDTLREVLKPFACTEADPVSANVTTAEWYADGFSGGENASQRRKKLAKALGLPDNLSSGALLEAVNLLCDRDTYEKAKQSI